MPQAFLDCIKNGGKVKTINPEKGKYLHICIPKGGGPSISGEVKTTQTKKRVLTYQQKARFKRLTDNL